MEPLRIAVFSDSVLPILNGVSISVDSLVHELRNQGHSVHVYAAKIPGHQDSDPNTFRHPGIPTPWALQYPVARPPYLSLLKRFRQHTYDIVHTHTPFVLGMVGLRWAESHEIPIVSTYHTLYDRYAYYAKLVPRRYIRFRIAKHTNFYYNNVSHVITPSEASAKWLRRHSVDTEITVIPTGTARVHFIDRSAIRQKMGVPADARILLYVGRLAREKNLATLIAAAEQVMRYDSQVRLWMVGDGPYREECLAEVRRRGIGDRVRFFGFVPRQEVDAYYAASDLFLFASITETQGLVVQEAMSHGLPAITVGGGGASASVVSGTNGFVVRNDATALAEAAIRVLGDQDLHDSLSTSALRLVREQSPAQMASRVLTVYRDAIQKSRSEAPRNPYASV